MKYHLCYLVVNRVKYQNTAIAYQIDNHTLENRFKALKKQVEN